jgi:hypothetical protein
VTYRFGTALIVLGALLILGSALQWANDDLLSIGGVGLVVAGAVAICIATDSNEAQRRT